MYQVFRASTLYYENYMKDAGVRYDLVKPYILLTKTELFQKEKKIKSPVYQNLCDIIEEMRRLKDGIKMLEINNDYGAKIKRFKFDGSHSSQDAMLINGDFIIYEKGLLIDGMQPLQGDSL